MQGDPELDENAIAAICEGEVAMLMTVCVPPHERDEALETYSDWLSRQDVDFIRNAPDDALIKIVREDGVTVEVSESGSI